MAYGSQYVLSSGKISMAAASGPKSAVLIVPAATKGFRLTSVEVSTDNSSAETGIQIDLYRVVTLGTPAGTTTGAYPCDETEDATPLATYYSQLTTEPTTKDVLKSWLIQPLGGFAIVQLPLGREYRAKYGGSGIGVQWTTPASVTSDLIVNVEWEE